MLFRKTDRKDGHNSAEPRKLTRRQFLSLSLLGATGYPVFIERYAVQVNNYTIPVPNLPDEFHNFRIVHLTDFHYGFLMPEFIIEYVVEKTSLLEKDMIVCTGDYVDKRNTTKEIDVIWPILGKLCADYGVYSVLGNHDHWASFSRSMEWMKKTGQDLRHKAIPIEKNGKRIWIGGAGDLYEDKDGIDEAFHSVPAGECKIVLAHNPDTADSYFRTRIDLMISGHTHGGQVQLPFAGPPILPVQNKLYSNGFIRAKKTNLFISKGLGWSIIPVRFNCYPEISVLNLVEG